MITPGLAQVQDWAVAGHTHCVVFRELVADLETPVSAYLKVAEGAYSFLLESVENGEQVGRYSFIGCEPRLVVRGLGRQTVVEGADGTRELFDDTSIMDVLERLVIGTTFTSAAPQPGLPTFTGGAVGFLGYETVRLFERLPAPASRPHPLPDSTWVIVDTVLAFDHVRHTIKVCSTLRFDAGDPAQLYAAAEAAIERITQRLSRPLPAHAAPSALRSPETPASVNTMPSNIAPDDYAAMIDKAREYIRAGDIFQVVLSQRFSRPTAASPFAVYRALRTVNPSPYMFFLQYPEAALIGASPEMLVRVQDGQIENRPIAGTRPRGQDQLSDTQLEAELLADEKELAEHLMLVDLGRNDVGRVARPGTVDVPTFMRVERYSHVMHLVSRVVGQLDPTRYSPLHALRACFPAGTLSGAPKVRAMEIIAELEPDQRGPYGGCAGYVSYGGQNLDTAITIRTLVMRDGVAYVQAGGGIVADSDAEREDQESRNKAGALLRALEVAEALEQQAVG